MEKSDKVLHHGPTRRRRGEQQAGEERQQQNTRRGHQGFKGMFHWMLIVS